MAEDDETIDFSMKKKARTRAHAHARLRARPGNVLTLFRVRQCTRAEEEAKGGRRGEAG
jgi:hypothetical protein